MENEHLKQINELQQTIQELLDENERLTALNKHYLYRFFDGDILKMQEEFFYIRGE